MQIIKHFRNKDVAFRVRKLFRVRDPHLGVVIKLKLSGVWINITNPRHIYDIDSDKIIIRSRDWPNWKEYVPL